MINLVIGIALGAAFSKFWLMLWTLGTAKVKTLLNKDKE